jgi:hypothetical protein
MVPPEAYRQQQQWNNFSVQSAPNQHYPNQGYPTPQPPQMLALPAPEAPSPPRGEWRFSQDIPTSTTIASIPTTPATPNEPPGHNQSN